MSQISKEEYPYISNLQRFSVDDGPGIRTTVFFKGCNLNCAWCHNPECIDRKITLQFLDNSCTGCGRCVRECSRGCHILNGSVHEIRRNLCIFCGKCAYWCPERALSLIGKQYEPDELLQELLKDQKYYETSEGGVTFSGGEPMLHWEYLKKVLHLAGNHHLHTAVDTAGNVPFSWYQEILDDTDLFLYDIKLWNRDRHLQATGVPNDQIKDNLIRLTECGVSIWIRIPVVMEWNGDLEEMTAIADFLKELPRIPEKIQLLPYHSYGAGKYRTIGKINRIRDHTPPADAFMEKLLALFLERDLPAQIS